MTERSNPSEYFPDRGFIGSREVSVSNYLFERGTGRGHAHARKLVLTLFGKTPGEHLRSSRKLTRWLEARGLTFRKHMKDGSQRTFAVPVTTSIVPLPRERFDAIGDAAAVLVVALRKVLQDIYGRSPEESRFASSLPRGEREVLECHPPISSLSAAVAPSGHARIPVFGHRRTRSGARRRL